MKDNPWNAAPRQRMTWLRAGAVSMAKHRRGSPLLRVLSRVWQRRDARVWVVRGHDEHGHSLSVRVSFDESGVRLTLSRPGELHLAPMQAGRLRGAIRTALEAIDQPKQAVRDMPPPAVERSARPELGPPVPAQRARVVLDDEPPTQPFYKVKHPLFANLQEVKRDHHDNSTAEWPVWPEHDIDAAPAELAA